MNSKFIAVALLLLPTLVSAADLTFRMQEIDATLKVGYGVVTADVNDDGKSDIIATRRQTGNMRIYWNEGRNGVSDQPRRGGPLSAKLYSPIRYNHQLCGVGIPFQRT